MKHCIGVDASKTYLNIDWIGKAWRNNNQAKDIQLILAKLKELQLAGELGLVICEASGGYERPFVKACHQSAIPIHMGHANKVRAFAKSQGILAKTDKMDACVLSDYGRLIQPEADNVLLSDNTEKIKSLLDRRNQLLKQKLIEQNRLEINESSAVHASIKRHMKWLASELDNIEAELQQLQRAEDISEKHKLLTSIPGIGNIAANYLIAFLPEIGKLSHKAAAALVGLAPYNRDSGCQRDKRFIREGVRSCVMLFIWLPLQVHGGMVI